MRGPITVNGQIFPHFDVGVDIAGQATYTKDHGLGYPPVVKLIQSDGREQDISPVHSNQNNTFAFTVWDAITDATVVWR